MPSLSAIMPRLRPTGLWRHRDFVTLWTAATVSELGSQVTLLALPLTAALYLHATPVQMGGLGAAQAAPRLLVSLFAGVVADRVRRRPLMMAADLGRALLLATIPLAALLGLVSMAWLYVVAFLAALLGIVNTIASPALLPSVVPRERLTDAYSKLEMARSLVLTAGPSLAGGLVQLVTAPVAISADAVSYLLSALLLRAVREPAGPVMPAAERGSIWGEIVTGLRGVVSSPALRAIAGSSALINFALYLQNAVFILFVTRELQVAPGRLGLIYTLGAPATFIGALVVTPLTRRFGLGVTIVASTFLLALGMLLIPLTGGPLWRVTTMLVASQILIQGPMVMASIAKTSLRQVVTPDRQLGRMMASTRFIETGLNPIGAVVGGALGAWVGVRVALFVGAGGVLLAFPWLLLSPVRALHMQPAPADNGGAELPQGSQNVST